MTTSQIPPIQFTPDVPKPSFSHGFSQVILSVSIPVITGFGTAVIAVIYAEPIKAVVVQLTINPLFIAGGFILVGTILLFKQIYDSTKNAAKAQAYEAKVQAYEAEVQSYEAKVQAYISQTALQQAVLQAYHAMPEVLKALETYPVEDDLAVSLKQSPCIIDPKANKIYRAQNGWEAAECDIYPPMPDAGLIFIYEKIIAQGGNKVVKIARYNNGKIAVATETDPKDEQFDSLRIYDHVFKTWNQCLDPKGGVVELYHRINIGPKARPYQQIVLQEPCLGGDLFTAIVARDTKYSSSQKEQIGLGVFKALELLHANNLYHRDVKPENVFLHVEKDGTIVSKLGDPDQTHFKQGIVHQPEDDIKIKMMSTLRAVPPEIFEVNLKDEEKIDLWGLGITLFFLHAGNDRVSVFTRLDTLVDLINKSKKSAWKEKLIEAMNYFVTANNEQDLENWTGKKNKFKAYPECQNMQDVRKAYNEIIFDWKNLNMSPKLKELLQGLLNPDVSQRFNLKTAYTKYEEYTQLN